MGREQRRTERIDVRFMAEFGLGQIQFPCECRDVSLHGLFIETRRAAPVGSLVRLRLYVPDGAEPFECYGWVRFCDVVKAGGMGIELFAMSYAETTRWGAYYYRCVAAQRQRNAGAAAQPTAA